VAYIYTWIFMDHRGPAFLFHHLVTTKLLLMHS
jgi:hypothetical protein